MDTDEKRRNIHAILIDGILLVILALFIILLIFESAYRIKSDVKKIIQSSEISKENNKLDNIAQESGYKAGLVLENCVEYIKELENNYSELLMENQNLTENVQNQTAEIQHLNREFALLSSEGQAKYQLCSLFTGGVDENSGAIYKEGLDDTIIYMIYVPKSEGGNAWEQYDRLEVDMYKRNGSWPENFIQSISTVLPNDMEESMYHVSILLRTDASRLSKIGDSPESPVNGGTVTFSVGDQVIEAPKMRLGIKDRDGNGTVLVQGGKEITLRISPQSSTSFFSFAVCLEKNTPDEEEGGTND